MIYIWRIVKFLLGLFLFAVGSLNYLYVLNDSISGYETASHYQDQELIGTGIIAGLGILLIISSMIKKPLSEDSQSD